MPFIYVFQYQIVIRSSLHADVQCWPNTSGGCLPSKSLPKYTVSRAQDIRTRCKLRIASLISTYLQDNVRNELGGGRRLGQSRQTRNRAARRMTFQSLTQLPVKDHLTHRNGHRRSQHSVQRSAARDWPRCFRMSRASSATNVPRCV